MYPTLGKPFARGLLVQSSKTLTTQLIRIYADKSDDIKLPPEPTTCCMSGCANCVWVEYAESLSKLLDGNDDKAREIILGKIQDPNLKMFLSLELKNQQYMRNRKKEEEKASNEKQDEEKK